MTITVTAAAGATFSFNDFITGVEAISRFGVGTAYSPNVSLSASTTHPVTGQELSVTAFGDIKLDGQAISFTTITRIDFYIDGKLQGAVAGEGLTGATLADVIEQAIAMDWNYIGTDAADIAGNTVTTPWGPVSFEPSGDNFLKLAGGDDNFYAGAGDDTMFGGDGHDTLYGAADQDMIYAGNGNDLLMGGAGSDQLFGGAGNDRVYAGHEGSSGEAGAKNLAWGGAGNDTVTGDSGGDMLGGGSGSDLIYGMEGADIIYGGVNNSAFDAASADTIHGGSGDDVIYAGSHDDLVHGDAGNDILYGGEGSDRLDGGDGSDQIWGGAGSDMMSGGAGADTFGFTIGSGADIIADFDATAGDRLDLQGQAFTETTNSAGDVVLTLSGGGSIMLQDVGSFDSSSLL